MKNNELEMRLKVHSENMKNSIEAPFDISEKLNETEKKNMSEKNVSLSCFKKTLYSIAAAAAAFVLIFNIIPSLAYAASDIPVLGDVVRIVTFGRFEVHEKNYESEISIPAIDGLANKELEARLNKELAENAEAVIAAFEADLERMSKEYGDEKFYLSVTADYSVKTDNDDILAVDFYIITTEASASTVHRFYNIDKKAGTLITLESLFAENADYVTPISKYIVGEMKKQNEDGTGYYFVDEEEIDGFEKIKADQNFYINDKGNIVICFDEYEVAAGAQGSPEFEVPHNVIESVLK